MECPLCSKKFLYSEIGLHVDNCLLGNNDESKIMAMQQQRNKRMFPFVHDAEDKSVKKAKVKNLEMQHRKIKHFEIFGLKKEKPSNELLLQNEKCLAEEQKKNYIPLAERLRPVDLIDYVGQKHMVGSKTVLGQLLEKKEITSMILWGPPGCGKTSLANVIAKMCKTTINAKTRFIKLSATSSGITDIRDVVTTAIKEEKCGHKTIVFMDEIHRFNKLQQDIFLPHVEAGIFILIGATTENPSFSLNSALLSRCRVFALEKLSSDEIKNILEKAVASLRGPLAENSINSTGQFVIEEEALQWLAEVCDGDARVALNTLELSIKSISSQTTALQPLKVTLDSIKKSLENVYTLSDKKGDQNHELVSAMHKSIKNHQANAALYWLARLMAAGEDPVYIGKRLIRIASEDVGLEDSDALDTAVHTMHGCQMIGMPECDVLLGQCVVYLCKAKKSRMADCALRNAQKIITEHKGPQPAVPLFIRCRSGQGKLQATIGRRLLQIDDHSQNHLPVGLEHIDFFNTASDGDNYK